MAAHDDEEAEPGLSPEGLAELQADLDVLLTPRLGLWVDVITLHYSTAERYARQVAVSLGREMVITDFLRVDGMLRVGVDLGQITESPQAMVCATMTKLNRHGWSRPELDGGVVTACWASHPRPERGVVRIQVVAGCPADDERFRSEHDEQ